MAKLRVHLVIEGRVQGVWFRDSTRRQAQSLGVSGWVRNLPDGRVEVLAEGETDRVERFVDWCHKGPKAAHVTRVIRDDEPWQGNTDSFDVRYG